MKMVKRLLPALGLLLLGYIIGKIGLAQILHNLAIMKWSFGLVLLLALSWHITNTIAWSFAFPPNGFRPPLHLLFMAKLAGEAVNQLTILGNIGGEPLKAYLLKHQSPTSRGLASVVINKTAQIFAGLCFTSLGLSLIVLNWNLAYSIPLSVQLSLGLLMILAIALLILLYRKQRRFFSSLLSILRHLGLKTEFIEQRMTKAVQIDDNISEYYKKNKGRFFLVVGFHGLGWLLGATETYVILHALNAGINLEIAYLITSLTVIITGLFFFMPSNIGVLESGQVFLFAALGLNPALGLSLAIIKRIRKLFWIAIGWFFLTHLSRNNTVEKTLNKDKQMQAQDSTSILRIPQL